MGEQTRRSAFQTLCGPGIDKLNVARSVRMDDPMPRHQRYFLLAAASLSAASALIGILGSIQDALEFLKRPRAPYLLMLILAVGWASIEATLGWLKPTWWFHVKGNAGGTAYRVTRLGWSVRLGILGMMAVPFGLPTAVSLLDSPRPVIAPSLDLSGSLSGAFSNWTHLVIETNGKPMSSTDIDPFLRMLPSQDRPHVQFEPRARDRVAVLLNADHVGGTMFSILRVLAADAERLTIVSLRQPNRRFNTLIGVKDKEGRIVLQDSTDVFGEALYLGGGVYGMYLRPAHGKLQEGMIYSGENRRLEIDASLPPIEQAATISHELAHIADIDHSPAMRNIEEEAKRNYGKLSNTKG
jgi:hypothetical protein